MLTAGGSSILIPVFSYAYTRSSATGVVELSWSGGCSHRNCEAAFFYFLSVWIQGAAASTRNAGSYHRHDR